MYVPTYTEIIQILLTNFTFALQSHTKNMKRMASTTGTSLTSVSSANQGATRAAARSPALPNTTGPFGERYATPYLCR